MIILLIKYFKIEYFSQTGESKQFVGYFTLQNKQCISYFFLPLQPKHETIPEGDWFCQECVLMVCCYVLDLYFVQNC